MADCLASYRIRNVVLPACGMSLLCTLEALHNEVGNLSFIWSPNDRLSPNELVASLSKDVRVDSNVLRPVLHDGLQRAAVSSGVGAMV